LLVTDAKTDVIGFLWGFTISSRDVYAHVKFLIALSLKFMQ
jgi:hypothetical protein